MINPYSPSAAFLPFTTYCLKLKRRAEGKDTKITKLRKERDRKGKKRKEAEIREVTGLWLDGSDDKANVYYQHLDIYTITAAFPK